MNSGYRPCGRFLCDEDFISVWSTYSLHTFAIRLQITRYWIDIVGERLNQSKLLSFWCFEAAMHHLSVTVVSVLRLTYVAIGAINDLEVNTFCSSLTAAAAV